MYLYVKFPLKNLNRSLCFSYSTNTYICTVTIALRVYGNVSLTFFFFFSSFFTLSFVKRFCMLSPLSSPLTSNHRPIAHLHRYLSSHFRSLQSLPILVFLAFLIALEIRKLMHCTNGTRAWYRLISWHPAL